MQIEVQPETQFARLLEFVADGQSVTLALNGEPVAELTRVRSVGFPLGIGRGDPALAELSCDEWWRPMTDEEADAWADGIEIRK